MMEQLVPEITMHALSYLDYPSLRRLSMTDSSLRRAANDDNAWEALNHKSLVQLENVKCVSPATIVKSMPILTFDGNKSEQGSTDEMEKCAICQFEYEFGDQIISLPCTHNFHNHCGAEWLLNHSKLCPICKHDVMDQKPVDTEFGP